MNPYYDDGDAVIYCGDSREILEHIGEADLIVTDPPYGIKYQGTSMNIPFGIMEGDESQDIGKTILAQSLKCLKKNRHIYFFGRFDVDDLPLSERAELIWNKMSPALGNTKTIFAKSHEYIQFATYVPSQANRESGQGRLAARLRRGSVLSHQRIQGGAVKLHPTEKPVSLLRELIEASSLFGEMVLDPFMGSGSTLVASRLEGRRSIGVEIEEKYCEIAAKRLAQMVMQL